MSKRGRSVVAVLMVFGLGMGIVTAVLISAMRTVAIVDHMGLA